MRNILKGSVLFSLILFLGAGIASASDRGLVRLAHQIDNQARHVHRSAERSAHHGGSRERRALRDLHQLENAAHHYHRQVERYWQNPRHTRHDYRRLVRSYRQARRSFRGAHAFRHIRRDFARVGRSIRELQRYYDGHRDPRDPHNPHGNH